VELFLRIGQLAEATGMDPAVLRAWESRYGIPQPGRTEGNQRRYDPREVERVKVMQQLVESGYRAGEAARVVKATFTTGGGTEGALPYDRDDLISLLTEGEMEAMRVLDGLALRSPLERIIEEVLHPVMKEVGERWATDRISVSEEHAATWIVSAWLSAQVRLMPESLRRGTVVTAAPQGERHELGLVMFGAFLRRQGVKVLHLGSDMPPEDLVDMIVSREADVAVLGVSTVLGETGMRKTVELLRTQDRLIPVCIGGQYIQRGALPLPAIALPPDFASASERVLTLLEGAAAN
jgi:methanogenic corrinoid protein MtbC1